MQQFRQWNQMNVDYGAQKMLILVLVIILPGTLTDQVTKTNLPDNPYWTSTRIMRLIQDQGILVTLLLDNKINDWLSAMVSFHLILTVNYKKRESMLEVLTYHHIQDVTAMFLNTIMMQCNSIKI
jgi:hypothetical protein